MPIQSCKENDKPGFRWGSKGRCYVYTPGDKASMKAAKKKAFNQGIKVAGSPEKAAREQKHGHGRDLLEAVLDNLSKDGNTNA
jgi:hypothetical protein